MAEPVTEMEKVEVPWDITIQTDHVIEQRRRCTRTEGQQEALLIDITTVEQQQEKVNKYQNMEPTRLWK